MDKGIWLAIFAIAIGTLAMRVLPLLWVRHQLARRQHENSFEIISGWLSALGPLMIAALLGVSMLPASPSIADGAATFLGASATLLVWYRRRSLGWPVLIGVLVYGAAKLASSGGGL